MARSRPLSVRRIRQRAMPYCPSAWRLNGSEPEGATLLDLRPVLDAAACTSQSLFSSLNGFGLCWPFSRCDDGRELRVLPGRAGRPPEVARCGATIVTASPGADLPLEERPQAVPHPLGVRRAHVDVVEVDEEGAALLRLERARRARRPPARARRPGPATDCTTIASKLAISRGFPFSSIAKSARSGPVTGRPATSTTTASIRTISAAAGNGAAPGPRAGEEVRSSERRNTDDSHERVEACPNPQRHGHLPPPSSLRLVANRGRTSSFRGDTPDGHDRVLRFILQDA